MGVPDRDLEAARAFCRERVPPDADLRIEVEVAKNNLTLVERRPPWYDDPDAEWTSLPLARLRWIDKHEHWLLDWQDANDHWHRYDDVPPVGDVRAVLAEIDRDPAGIFWG
jgi:hypothetical protein